MDLGQTIILSGMMSVQLRSLSGYQSGLSNLFLSPQMGTPWTPHLGLTYPTTTATTLPSFIGSLGIINMNLSTVHKGCFYNREKFLKFIDKCQGKFPVFIDDGVEKIVEKSEALKFVFFHFLAAKDYHNWDDFRYEDDEWILYLKEAKTAPEILEEFDFDYEKIREILSI